MGTSECVNFYYESRGNDARGGRRVIPKGQQIVLVPEHMEVQRLSDGNLMLLGRDLETQLIIGFVVGENLARSIGEALIAPSIQVVRHAVPPEHLNGGSGPVA